MNDKTYRFLISASEETKVQEWFKSRGGAIEWSCVDLSYTSKPHQLTPALTEDGKSYPAPHWSMGDPKPIQSDEIGVTTIEPLQAPRSLFADCDKCKGSGKRSLTELATIRGESIDELRQKVGSNQSDKVTIYELNWEEDTFQCTYCMGTGCDHSQQLYSRFILLPPYKGGGVALKSTRKAESACRLLEKETGRKVEYDFECWGDGTARLRFFHETIRPFVVVESKP